MNAEKGYRTGSSPSIGKGPGLDVLFSRVVVYSVYYTHGSIPSFLFVEIIFTFIEDILSDGTSPGQMMVALMPAISDCPGDACNALV